MNNISPKISVIVPIFNVEAYIERCARSLFEQTLDNIEYIFINDCTPDRSMEILNNILSQYPERENQVLIINHHINRGAAYAREVGIKAAKGEYIIHCDPDDWIDLDMYNLMYNKAKNEGVDMVICDWYRSDGKNHTPEMQELDNCPDVLRKLINCSICGSLCNKLIVRKKYLEIQNFPTEHLMEDLNYSIQLAIICNGSISYLKKPLYYYYLNPQSIYNNPSDDYCISRCKQACVNIDQIIAFLKSYNLDYKYRYELVVLKNRARVFLWPLYMREPNKYRKMWRSVYPEINWIYPFTPGIFNRYRLIFFLANIGVYPYILKVIKLLKTKN